jgi:ankyrin repeat protein
VNYESPEVVIAGLKQIYQLCLFRTILSKKAMNTFYKSLCTFFLVICAITANSQNILLNRSFWKQQPSIEEIEKKIKEGHSPTEMTAFNFDATVYALLENNSLETVKYLLAQGNPIDRITHDGRTYLMWAAYKGNLEAMKYLVSQGSPIDIVDQHGYSLFMFPASTGQSNLAMYDYIIDELGFDIQNEKDRKGRNALVACASSIKDFTLVDYFVSKGLDINSVDSNGNGIFHYAAQTGNEGVMKKLAKEYKVNTSPNGKTNENAILFATRRFSRSGAETDLSFYQFLEKEFKLNPAIVSNNGNNALHNLATRTKNVEVINYFVEKGTDPNQFDEDGNNALIYASSRGNEEIIRYLILKTEDLNTKNRDGESALTHAVKYNSLDVVKLLTDKGADVKILDKNGNTLAYHLVDSYNGFDDFKEKSGYLTELGLDMKAKQKDGSTLIHTAIKKNDTSLLEALLSYGIDINEKNNNGETALHLAALQSKDEQMLKFLVSAGAKLELTTAFEETAYDLAKNNELLAEKNVEFLKVSAK